MTALTTHLAECLLALDTDALIALCELSGVELKIARRATKEQPIAAADALALLAALGIEPMSRKAIPPKRLGELDQSILALMLIGRMSRLGHGTRNAASVMGVSERVVYAIRDGKAVSLPNVQRACAYIDVHPFELCGRAQAAA